MPGQFDDEASRKRAIWYFQLKQIFDLLPEFEEHLRKLLLPYSDALLVQTQDISLYGDEYRVPHIKIQADETWLKLSAATLLDLTHALPQINEFVAGFYKDLALGIASQEEFPEWREYFENFTKKQVSDSKFHIRQRIALFMGKALTESNSVLSAVSHHNGLIVHTNNLRMQEVSGFINKLVLTLPRNSTLWTSFFDTDVYDSAVKIERGNRENIRITVYKADRRSDLERRAHNMVWLLEKDLVDNRSFFNYIIINRAETCYLDELGKEIAFE
jgi:hypothetical protein